MNSFIEQIKKLAINSKYTNWYINIVTNAQKRGLDRKKIKQEIGYIEQHHILPKSFNTIDINNKKNLVMLTPKEHFICHLCLAKMFTGFLKNKMIHALWRLKSKNKYQKNRYFNSKLYAQIRIKNFDKSLYIRIYKNEKVKYVARDNTKEINQFLNNGWSTIMTPEFKKGRVGNMLGKKHTDETKNKISQAHKGKQKHWLKSFTPEQLKIRGEKSAQTRKKRQQEYPERYKQGQESKRLKRLEAIQLGLISFKGKKNPNYGKKHTEEIKQKISNKRNERFNKGYTDEQIYNLHIKNWLSENISFKEMSRRLKELGFRKSGFKVHCIIDYYCK
jgi:hypothetical protein